MHFLMAIFKKKFLCLNHRVLLILTLPFMFVSYIRLYTISNMYLEPGSIRFGLLFKIFFFQSFQVDPSLFFCHTSTNTLILLVYVDDILVIGICSSVVDDPFLICIISFPFGTWDTSLIF